MLIKYILKVFESEILLDFEEDTIFNEGEFFIELERISGIKVLAKKNIHRSLGPLSYIDSYTTTKGDVRMEKQIEMVDHDIQFFSSNRTLLDSIVKTLRESNLYKECSNYQDMRSE